jgi:hypothetical protein
LRAAALKYLAARGQAVRIRWLEGLLVEVPEEARREAERALALVDPGGLGDYEVDGSFATLYSGEGLLLKLARLEGRLVILAAAWACGGLVEEYIAGEVEE